MDGFNGDILCHLCLYFYTYYGQCWDWDRNGNLDRISDLNILFGGDPEFCNRNSVKNWRRKNCKKKLEKKTGEKKTGEKKLEKKL